MLAKIPKNRRVHFVIIGVLAVIAVLMWTGVLNVFA